MSRWMIAAALLLASVTAHAQSIEGEVRKIDLSQGKLTLKHAEIKALDMPAMTMVFKLRDSKQAEGLSVGDKVLFEAQRIDGQYTVTALKRTP